MQYKEHIIQLTNTNAALTKKLKSLEKIEEKYEDAKQQNEVFEAELKNLESMSIDIISSKWLPIKSFYRRTGQGS